MFAQNTLLQSYSMSIYLNCVKVYVLLIAVNSYSPRTGVGMPAFADIRTLFRTVHNLLDMNTGLRYRTTIKSTTSQKENFNTLPTVASSRLSNKEFIVASGLSLSFSSLKYY
jgi:hypothetical protein